MTPTEKDCTQCGATKPLDEFSVNRAGRYGRFSKCKRCVAANDTGATERKRRWRERARPDTGNRTPRPDPDPSWREKAACVSHPVALWYSSPDTDRSINGSPRRKTPAEQAAIAICEVCPVKAPCLQYALDAKEPAGIFGGLTEPERRALMRRRRGAAS